MQRTDHGPQNTADDDPLLLNALAVIAVLGSVALVLGNIVGSVLVPGHDWIADTVSDLAAGELEIIQDVALYGYAAALLALALGAANLHRRSLRWSGSILSLSALAALVIVIGARNEYGDGDADGVVVHIYLVYGLGVLFTVVMFAMAKGLGAVRPVYRRISLGCGVLWALGAPVFSFLPTSIDGAWERGLGVITVIWVLTVAAFIRDAARNAQA